MDFALVTVPAAPVRRKPDHRREMVNQLLFGERVRIIRDKGPLWVKVESLHDGYRGWMTRTQLQEISRRESKTPVTCVTSRLLQTLDWNGASMQVPAGAGLPAFSEGKGEIGEITYTYSGEFFDTLQVKPSASLAEQLALGWLHAPYCWGGRTPLGVDCSGFTQVIFKMMGIPLARDAWQQARQGTEVKKWEEARPGDLLFFDNTEDIVHVGLLLPGERMIHASGRVRIDPVDKKGVAAGTSGQPAYRLSCIRRYWEEGGGLLTGTGKKARLS
jgi:cell wall-associated NlpC family hydrolase